MKSFLQTLSPAILALILTTGCETTKAEREYEDYMREKHHLEKHIEEDKYEQIKDSVDFEKFEHDRKERDRRRHQRDAKWDRRWESWTNESW